MHSIPYASRQYVTVVLAGKVSEYDAARQVPMERLSNSLKELQGERATF